MDFFKYKYLDQLNKDKLVIALVGAGGKTSIMYQLAEHYALEGRKVLVTTSTHIFQPLSYYRHCLAQVEELWQQGRYAVIGAQVAGGKLAAPDDELLQQCLEKADIVLIEADGARNLPCKVPGEHEPVIPACTNVVLGLVGLDSVGQRIASCCFRPKLVAELLQVDQEHLLTEEDIAEILLSDKGTSKAVDGRELFFVLNKCDDEARQEAALKIAAQLAKAGVAGRHIWIRGEGFHE